jgi:sphingomyelin phosphodiesterase 2
MSDAWAKGHIVLAMGDFNMLPLSLAHKIIEIHGRAQDVWRLKYPDSSIGAAQDEVEKRRGRPLPSATYNLTVNGATCDSVLNTWRWNKPEQKRLARGETIVIDPKTDDPKAKRLDYVFLGDALNKTIVRDVRVGMTQRHPQLQCSLSDHFSVEATIEQGIPSSITGDDKSSPHRHIEQRGGHIDDSPRYLPAETYDSILTMINTYVGRQRRQRRLRMGHLFAETGVAIGCLIAVWWSPRNYVSFLLMLLSTLGFAAGILDGLIGGFFVSSELRALKEFEWEVRNAREAAVEAARVPGAIGGEGEVNGALLRGSITNNGIIDD